ncbi:hypothetical protein [Oleiharenicola lentus]|uniref:hypothetical protein n=1 Tax=Oleiharenicola lentus TaxID=2508720 RepID=UPI003F66EE16
MAKKPTTLTFRDIVLGAEADVIRQALEARVKIDALLAERQAAYARIADLEVQVETVVGEAGIYPFPQPPLPVAGFDPKADTVNRGAPGAKKSARPTGTTETEDESADEGDETSGQA